MSEPAPAVDLHPAKREVFDVPAMTNTDNKGFVRPVELYRETPYGLYMVRTADHPRFDRLESWLLPALGLRASRFHFLPHGDPGWRTYLDVGDFHGPDADGRWRRHCNAALARDYPALWRRIDRLLFLQPPGFEVVPEWRWQQEQALRASDPGARGMDRDALARFVQHYERVSRQALRVLPARADVVVELDRARRPVALRLRDAR